MIQTPQQADLGGGSGDGSGDGLRLQDLIGVLRRQVWLVGSITLLTTGVVGYIVFTQAPDYRATGVIRLADTRGSITGGIADEAVQNAMGQGSDPLLSQLEVLKGRQVLGEVVDREGLRLVVADGLASAAPQLHVLAPESASDTVRFQFSPASVTAAAAGETVRAAYGEPLRFRDMTITVAERPEVSELTAALIARDAAIDDLARELTAKPRDRTDAVDVQYAASSPQLAQRVVNSAIEVFQAASATAAQEQSRRRRLFLQGQLESVDSMLANMQVALSAFRSQNQVYSSRDKISAQQQGLMGLDVRLEELSSDRRMYQSLLSQLDSRGANRVSVLRTLVSSPEIASNAVVAQLYAQLVQYESARDSLMTGTLGATTSHPDVQRVLALINGTQDKLVDAIESHVASLDARIAALGGLRDRNAGEISSLPATEAEEVRLVQRVETTQKMGEELRAELQRARINEAVEAGQVEIVNTAPLPRRPVSDEKPQKLGLGLALGLFLGGALGLIREHLNSRINRREEVESLLHVPGLAVIPQIGGMGRHRELSAPIRLAFGGVEARRLQATSHRERELVAVSDTQSSGAEAFRMLRTNLLFSDFGETLKTLMITSATPGEGKTTTSSNLAATFAHQGLRILLVDCDLRRARLHRMFDLPLAPGLSDVVSGAAPASSAIQPTAVDGLSLMTAGTHTENPAELLGGRRMKRMLELLPEGFDLVILDTPPVMAAADAAILGARVDGVLLVVRAGHTERAAAQFAMQQLQGVGARVVGAVLNDPDAQVPLYGGYSHYDYYNKSAETVA